MASAWSQPVNYEMVLVGNAGNVADTTGFGAVPYEYQIGKYEVTIGQYAAFLNAAAKADPYGLYSPSMETDLNIAGIARTGISGDYEYTVIGPFGDVQIAQATSTARPITYVSWFDAARFANWMSNGQPTGPYGPETTENGTYELNGATSGVAPSENQINPNTLAPPTFRLPSENEWYKAAFYKAGSTDAGYWLYPTQSEEMPGNVIGPGTSEANWRPLEEDGYRYSLTQSQIYSPNQNYLTDVGAFTGSVSPYGTFDQGGSVWEWVGTSANGPVRVRGGDWFDNDSDSTSVYGIGNADPSGETYNFGFRLSGPVPVPEPSTWLMAATGLTCAGWLASRQRRR